MKAQFLKLAGVKNEADFYKKFPTEKAFMAKYGAQVKKLMQAGGIVDANQNKIPDYLEVDPYAPDAPEFGPQDQPRNLQPLNQITPRGINKYYGTPQGKMLPKMADTTQPAFDTGQALKTGIGMVDSVVGGIQALKAEKKALKSARTWRDVSNISRKAHETEDVDKNRMLTDNQKRLRKEMMPSITGEELFPVTGVGTNVLAKYGGYMQGGGEIMNTYAPQDIYQDLGYEPLAETSYAFEAPSEDEIIKQYRSGGLISVAQGGFSLGNAMNYFGGKGGGATIDPNATSGIGATPWASVGNVGASMAGALTGNNAGSQIGGGLGEAAGSFFGPVGGAVGKAAGTLIGGLVDRNPAKTKKAQGEMMRNVNAMAGMDNLRSYWGGYSGSFEDGGYLSHDWQPQVITHFGDNSMHELLDGANDDMRTLRSGGNIRSNEIGDIQIDGSRGALEHLSYNPYTPGTGITSMIKGPSHDRGGVNIAYNGNMVEAEGGEPISERQDGGSIGDTSAVIAGDQTFGKLGATIIPELKEFEGQKVKHIQKKLALEDAKLNKLQTKNTKALNEFEVKTPIDKLTFNSLAMNEKGSNIRYKTNANKAEHLLSYQDAVNRTAQDLNLDAGELTRGNVKAPELGMAKAGKKLPKTTTDETTRVPVEEVVSSYAMPDVPKGQHQEKKYWGKVTDLDFVALQEENPWYDWDTFDPYSPDDVKHFQRSYNKLAGKLGSKERLVEDGRLGEQTASARVNLGNKPGAPAATTTPTDKNYDVTKYSDTGLETIAAQLMPWFRKPPGEPLQGQQLAGEMYAMQDKEEPVQARFFHPNLDVPYDISLQDQLNENQADFNALSRKVGNNPEALAALAGQKYMANSKVLGEQFRLNQAKKDQVYSGNRATLNDAMLKNLAIADQQYVRQAQAKSNTKEIFKGALDSIAAKIGQNRLENRQLQVGSNEFGDFSYDANMRLRKTGAPTTWNIPQMYGPHAGKLTHLPVYDKDGNPIGFQQVDTAVAGSQPSLSTPGINPDATKQKVARHGSLVRAFKNL